MQMRHVGGMLWVVLGVLMPGLAAHAAVTDWDLYAMRLVNRARLDPAGEAGRLGSGVYDGRSPVAPLAYDLDLDEAAYNHNSWMHANLGGIASGATPDSFTHYETLDGSSGGTPAIGTPHFTGTSIGIRVTDAGFAWSACAENLAARWANYAIPVNATRIEDAHKGLWESTGHRNNLLSGTYTAHGHEAETRSVVGGIGNLPSWATQLFYATHNFAKPKYLPYRYIFGLLYDDRDSSGGWTPRDVGHGLHEGLGGVRYEFVPSSGGAAVASGVTMAHGAYSEPVNAGTYDVVFESPALPEARLTVAGVTLGIENIDAGDTVVDTLSLSTWQAVGGNWGTGGNWTGGVPMSTSGALVDNGGTATMAAGGQATNLFVGWLGTGAVVQTGGSAAFELLLVGPGGSYGLGGGVLDAVTVEAAGAFAMTGGTAHLSTFDGNLVNAAGTFAPGASPGAALVTGTYMQGPAGTLAIDIAGLQPESDHDAVYVDGTAALGGTLDLTLDGFTPAYGDMLTVLTSAGLSGMFASVGGAAVSADLALAVTYTATDVRVTGALPGDTNLDGLVDTADYFTLAGSWFQAATWAGGDVTGDGLCDTADYFALADHWFQSVPTQAPAPEPATVVLLAAGVAVLAGRKG